MSVQPARLRHLVPLKRGALDDAKHQRRKAVVLRGRRGRDAAHRRHVVILHAAAERVRHQAFGQRLDEAGRVGQQRPAQLRRAVELGAVDQCARQIQRADPLRSCESRRRRRSSRARTRAGPSSCGTWRSVGLTRCCSMRSRIVAGAGPLPVFSLNAGTPGGGSGGITPRMLIRIHLPRRTGEVRSALAVTVSMLPWPSRPRRMSSSGPSSTRRNWLP